ncbi:MAG: tRNA glutamyl-Q(34) synthetase GluQRS [Acidiferrobacterales bacterium]
MIVGRFAPSPTGPLHFGSLVAALGSYLSARQNQGRWLLRIEDLDPPREIPGATEQIIRTLDALGFEWDGAISYQSKRLDLYRDAVHQLEQAGMTYRCTCSRREITETGLPGLEGILYPGTCRTAKHQSTDSGIRVVTNDTSVVFEDKIQGRQEQRLQTDVGDFIVQRRGGLMAYQVAVVVDDADQGITEVVRGSDLLASTPRQIYLQRLLGLDQPDYIHLPVATNSAGDKLSKQTGAIAIDITEGSKALCAALEFLSQQPPPELSDAPTAEILAWGVKNWEVANIPEKLGIPYENKH